MKKEHGDCMMPKVYDFTRKKNNDDVIRRVEGVQEILRQVAHIVSVTIHENDLILEELKK